MQPAQGFKDFNITKSFGGHSPHNFTDFRTKIDSQQDSPISYQKPLLRVSCSTSAQRAGFTVVLSPQKAFLRLLAAGFTVVLSHQKPFPRLLSQFTDFTSETLSEATDSQISLVSHQKPFRGLLTVRFTLISHQKALSEATCRTIPFFVFHTRKPFSKATTHSGIHCFHTRKLILFRGNKVGFTDFTSETP